MLPLWPALHKRWAIVTHALKPRSGERKEPREAEIINRPSKLLAPIFLGIVPDVRKCPQMAGHREFRPHPAAHLALPQCPITSLDSFVSHPTGPFPVQNPAGCTLQNSTKMRQILTLLPSGPIPDGQWTRESGRHAGSWPTTPWLRTRLHCQIAARTPRSGWRVRITKTC